MSTPVTIDARGLKCPLPVLRAEKALDTMEAGGLEVLADDPVARIDIPLLAQKRGLDCAVERDGDTFCFLLTKKPVSEFR